MSDELDNELANGDVYAERLAEHLIAMGADRCVIPVRLENGIRYEITVEIAKEQ